MFISHTQLNSGMSILNILSLILKRKNMKFKSINTLVALSLILAACGSDDDGVPTGTVDPEIPITASYSATITTDFTEENFPTDYPSDATFGTIVVITHAPDVNIYSLGQLASEGVEDYVENGDVDALRSFISAQLGEENEGKFIIQTENTIAANASKTFNLTITPTRSRVTILANINPSPDWFVGVSSFDIIDGETLITNATIGLQAIDAGTSTGDTYTDDGDTENAAISIRSEAPFSNGGPTPQIGSIEISREN